MVYYYNMVRKYYGSLTDPQTYSDKAEDDIDSLHDYLYDPSVPDELQDRVTCAVAEMISCLEELNRTHKAYYKL